MPEDKMEYLESQKQVLIAALDRLAWIQIEIGKCDLFADWSAFYELRTGLRAQLGYVQYELWLGKQTA